MPESHETASFTQMVTPLKYAAIVFQNREVFLLNYGRDFHRFDLLLSRLQSTWSRVARERDTQGRSHVGLLMPAMILIRHCMLGFQQLVSYQSFLAWLALRPGLEALLILGKWVDDPGNAKLWKERDQNPAKYSRAFSGAGLASRSLPDRANFRRVLSRINDQFVHPNASFAYRETSLRRATADVFGLRTGSSM